MSRDTKTAPPGASAVALRTLSVREWALPVNSSACSTVSLDGRNIRTTQDDGAVQGQGSGRSEHLGFRHRTFEVLAQFQAEGNEKVQG
jgi:hypothetical protein